MRPLSFFKLFLVVLHLARLKYIELPKYYFSYVHFFNSVLVQFPNVVGILYWDIGILPLPKILVAGILFSFNISIPSMRSNPAWGIPEMPFNLVEERFALTAICCLLPVRNGSPLILFWDYFFSTFCIFVFLLEFPYLFIISLLIFYYTVVFGFRLLKFSYQHLTIAEKEST